MITGFQAKRKPKTFPKIADTLLFSQAMTPTSVIPGIPTRVLSAIFWLFRQS
jgi:hypothetical protein